MIYSSKSILFLITSLEYGGAQTQLIPIALNLKKMGWRISIVSMRSPEAFIEELYNAEIPVESLDMPKGIPDPRAIFKLATLIRKWKPQILNSHMFHANILARVTRLLVKIPVLISTAHNVNEKSSAQEDLNKASWFEIAYRLTDPLSDMTTTICQAGVDRYIQVKAVPEEKILYIPNTVDTNRFQENNELRNQFRASLNLKERFTWLAIGRFDKQKDYPTMLTAFSVILKRHPNALLLICGAGCLEIEIKNLILSLNIKDYVRMLGIRRDIPQLMNAADAYVMSSAWEGMPIVLLEASATGLPIVATDVGGNSEVVFHTQNGFLSPPKDFSSLASQMDKLMSLPLAERLSMGKKGIEIINRHHRLDHLILVWQNFYLQMKNKKSISSKLI